MTFFGVFVSLLCVCVCVWSIIIKMPHSEDVSLYVISIMSGPIIGSGRGPEEEVQVEGGVQEAGDG